MCCLTIITNILSKSRQNRFYLNLLQVNDLGYLLYAVYTITAFTELSLYCLGGAAVIEYVSGLINICILDGEMLKKRKIRILLFYRKIYYTTVYGKLFNILLKKKKQKINYNK